MADGVHKRSQTHFSKMFERIADERIEVVDAGCTPGITGALIFLTKFANPFPMRMEIGGKLVNTISAPSSVSHFSHFPRYRLRIKSPKITPFFPFLTGCAIVLMILVILPLSLSRFCSGGGGMQPTLLFRRFFTSSSSFLALARALPVTDTQASILAISASLLC